MHDLDDFNKRLDKLLNELKVLSIKYNVSFGSTFSDHLTIEDIKYPSLNFNVYKIENGEIIWDEDDNCVEDDDDDDDDDDYDEDNCDDERDE